MINRHNVYFRDLTVVDWDALEILVSSFEEKLPVKTIQMALKHCF